jgi:hypothetical protein
MRPPVTAEDLQLALSRLVRTGRVSSVDAKKHTARVQFIEGDGADDSTPFVTGDLQVMVHCGGDYGLPPADAQVLCLMLPGWWGIGFVLGVLYSEADAPPLDNDGKRALVSEDLRLGAADADKKIALAPPTKDNFDKLKDHLQALEAVITGAPIPEPGNGSPSAFQTALQAAIQASPLPSPDDVAAENVSAK